MARHEILERARKETDSVKKEHLRIVDARNTNAFDKGHSGFTEGELVAQAEMRRLYERIAEAVGDRQDQLLVMGIASEDAMQAMKDVYPLIQTYLWEDKIFMQAFEVLYSLCREQGLNPEKRVITKHNGKDIPPYYELLIKW